MKDKDKTKIQLIAELKEMRKRVCEFEKTQLFSKYSDKTLHDNEWISRIIFDHAYEFIGLMTLDGILIDANKASLDFYGLSESEVIGKPFWETPWWTHSKELKENLRQSVKKASKGELIRFEVSHPAPDGIIHYVDLSIKPVKNDAGEVVFLIPEGRDITDQKRVTDALKESENCYRSTADSSPMGMHFYKLEEDDRLIFTSANPAADRLLGVDNSIFIGKTIEEAFPPLKHTEVPKRYRQAAAVGKSWSTEQIQYEEGHIKGAFEVVAFQTEPNKMVAMFNNITERKQAAEEIQKLADVVKHSGELVNLATLDGKMVFLNKSGSRMLGIDPKEVEHKNIMEVIPEHLIDLVESELLPTLKKGKIWEGDLQYRNLQSGALTDVHAMTFTVKDPDTQRPLFLANVSMDITERKFAENELLKFKLGIERSTDAIFITDIEGNIIYINPAFEELYGFTASEAIGHTPRILKSGIIPAEVYKDFWEKLLSKDTVSGEIINKTKDDRLITIEGSNNPIINDKEEIIGFLGIHRDVTERKKADEALTAERNRAKSILEGTNAGTWDWNVQTGEVIFNDRWAGIIGHTLKELEPINIQTWISKVHPDDLINANEQLEKHFAGKQNYYDVEFRQPHKNGKWIWVHARGKVVKWTEDGKPLQMSGIHLDITKRKQAEDALRENEAKYRHLIEESGDAIYLLYNRRFEIVNTKFTELFGVTFEQANSPEFDFINLVALESRPFIEERVRLQSEGHKLESKYEFEALNHKGQVILVEASVTYIKYKQGVAAQGIIRDISEKRNLQEQLQQAQKMEAIGTLAGGIAHDFNNLLTVINGYSEIALNKINSTNPLYKIIEPISEAGNRAVNLTSQLLAFSRKQIYNAEIVDINTVINEMEKMLHRLIGEDISMNMNLAKNILKIKADKSQLEQIFINLIVNARDAVIAVITPEFKKKITIETGSIILDKDYVSKHPGSQEGPYVFFSVSDNGIGIDEESKKKIFEPFFTTKEKFKGTGLGMSMVYGIVKQNNGSIYVYSEVNKGTMFKIYWPISEENAVHKIDEILETGDFTGNESILVVEDDNEVCRFAKDALTSLGYNVSDASNGKIAFDLIKKEKQKFDLIVTDLIMPELNGKEFIEKVKRVDSDVKVIYVSGYTDNHIVHDGMLEKDINFIHKPYSINTLSSKIRKVLNQK